MQDNSLVKHVSVVNKCLNWFFFTVGFIMLIAGVITKTIATSIIPLSVTIVSAFVAFFLRHKKKETAASIVLVASALIQVLPLMLMVRDNAFVLAMLPISVGALYLNTWIFAIVGIITNIFTIILQLSNPTPDMVNALFACIMQVLITIILFLLVRAGAKLIRAANENGVQLSILLDQLQKTMDAVRTNTSVLKTDISRGKENLGIVREISNSIASAAQEISTGIVSQSESVSQINQTVKKADEKVSELIDFSNQLGKVTTNTSNIVTEGFHNINTLDKQMEIINQSVTKSVETVQELSKNMDEIYDFLSGITHIAEQTNLLALNAAIEAARAGESGKGFAVVAGEVKQLAEQSSSIVEQINQIIHQIKNKTKNVFDEVSRGQEATQDGEKVVKSVNLSFEMIQDSFKNMNQYIADEISRIENIADLFSNIEKEIDRIASISEGHAAAVEELSATIQEHTASIEIMNNLMQNIKDSSDNLQAVIQ